MPREWPVWQIIRGLDIVTKDNQPVQNKVVSGTKTSIICCRNSSFPSTGNIRRVSSCGVQPAFNTILQSALHSLSFKSPRSPDLSIPTVMLVKAGTVCTSKSLDNAIVGYCGVHELMSENKKHRRREQELLKAVENTLRNCGKWDEFHRLRSAGMLDEAIKLLAESRQTDLDLNTTNGPN